MRNHTKTGTKGAQTTDNRTEGSTEENEQWNTSTSIHKNNKHQPSIQKTQNMKGREDNTDDRKRRGQHKRQAQIWTDMDKTQE